MFPSAQYRAWRVLLPKQALVSWRKCAFHHFLYYADYMLILLSRYCNNPISAVLPQFGILLMEIAFGLHVLTTFWFSAVWARLMQLGHIRAWHWVHTTESQNRKSQRFRWLETSLDMSFIKKLRISFADAQVFLNWSVFQFEPQLSVYEPCQLYTFDINKVIYVFIHIQYC